MIIGNITIGGSGKTPLIISLVDYFQKQGVKVGVISRGYGGDTTQMPALVTLDSLPDVVGDEPCLIVQSSVDANNPIPMSVCPNRQQAIELLLKNHPNLQLIISDDGLQHYKLQRDIEWIVVDTHRGFGNRKLLPAGFLREPISRLNDSTVVHHITSDTLEAKSSTSSIKHPEDSSVLTMSLKPSDIQPLLEFTTTERPEVGDTLIAMSGIGYPIRFFTTLRELGYNIEEKPFPDHHEFTFNDLRQFIHTEKPIIITSKDAVKLRYLANQELDTSVEDIAKLSQVFSRIWVLPVRAELNAECYNQLNSIIAKVTA